MDIVKKIKNYTYNQRHCLGQGSFGRVYQGKSDEGLKVAIKRVQQSMISKDKYLKASLQSEINIMQKLKHPNIVKLFDVVTTNNSIYLIMEFCAGGDLKRYCRNKKVTQEQATNIVKNIVKAFQQIVQLGIIHRDLKPANILVHQGVFKVCDFGFAKFFKDTSRMTRTCVGTPIYMSPQVLAQKNYTDKTDIWSLGILFYELLFAKLPYYGSNEEALYKVIMKSPLSIPPCSNYTMSLLRGMLQVQQSKRHSWNKVFEVFGFGTMPEIKQSQTSPEKQYNGFYRQVEPNNFVNEKPQRQNYPTNLYNSIKEGNFNIEDDQYINNKKPQKRPINPLAFQNPIPQNNIPFPEKNQINQVKPQIVPNPPIHNLNRRPSVQDQPGENPRFLYFVLIELIVEPMRACPSYPQLISSLYKKTQDLYIKFVDRQKTGTLYSKILANELEQLNAIKSQIPNFPNQNLQQSAQSVLKQANLNQLNFPSLIWVNKILNQNYSYDK